jgi:hypothetical protein
MRYLVSEAASKVYVSDGLDGLPVHKAAAQLLIQDPRPPKNKQLFIDAFKYAKPAYTTPYGTTGTDVFNRETLAMWNEGVPARTLLPPATAKANTAMQEEIAADAKK